MEVLKKEATEAEASFSKKLEELNQKEKVFLAEMTSKQEKELKGNLSKSIQRAKTIKPKFHSSTLQAKTQERFSMKNRLFEPANFFSNQLNSLLLEDKDRLEKARRHSVEVARNKITGIIEKQTSSTTKRLSSKKEELLIKQNEVYKKIIKKCQNAKARNYENIPV